eukprot:7461523-Pyramimonas_sp.AAC.1
MADAVERRFRRIASRKRVESHILDATGGSQAFGRALLEKAQTRRRQESRTAFMIGHLVNFDSELFL